MPAPHGQNKILERFSTILRVEQFCTVFAAARAFNGGEDLFSRHRRNGRGARPLPIARFVRSGGRIPGNGGIVVAGRSLRATRRSLLVRVDMETLNYRERSRPADALALPNSPLLIDLDDARPLAQAIVDTVRDPLLVLDQDLRVVTANRAFYQAFRMNLQDIHGRPIYGL